jgi:hypothetical protein
MEEGRWQIIQQTPHFSCEAARIVHAGGTLDACKHLVVQRSKFPMTSQIFSILQLRKIAEFPFQRGNIAATMGGALPESIKTETAMNVYCGPSMFLATAQANWLHFVSRASSIRQERS